MLTMIKVTHTIVWAIMAVSNITAFYFAYMGRFDLWFFIPASILSIQILILLLTWWKCPLTTWAEKYTDNRRANFDIYLPETLARINVRLFAVLIALEIVIVVVKNYL